MKFFLFTLGIFSCFLSNAQKPSDEQVITAIIDTLVKGFQFSFYYEKLKHYETQEFALQPLDSFYFFDPETYEETSRSGIESKVYYDSINLYEAQLFKQRLNFPDGMYLIHKTKSSHVHRGMDLSDYIQLPSYPDIKDIGEFSNSLFAKGKLGPYIIRKGTSKNYETYKYAMKAQFSFSGVAWDKTGTYGLIECGFHYMIPEHRSDRGQSGSGFQAIVENKNGILRFIKFKKLWDE